MESDCGILIQALKSCVSDYFYFDIVIRDYQSRLKDNSHISITSIKNSANQTVYIIVKVDVSKPDFVWDMPPQRAK